MSDTFAQARALIREFKGDRYIFGSGVLEQVGPLAAHLGKRAVLVYTVFPGNEVLIARVRDSLLANGVTMLGEIEGAGPNAPREDVFRIADALEKLDPDVIVCLGGGSTLDATKAAEVLRTLGGEIDEYFGTGKVTEKLQATGKKLTPHRGHPDRRQLRRAPDQVLQHHRCADRPEEADRGRGHRAGAGRLRL